MPLNLTTLANAEAWIGDLTPGDSAATDALINRLITAASGLILSFVNRPTLLPQTYTETRDGTGGPRLMLRNWPVTAVAAVTIGGTAILAGSYSGQPTTNGWAGYFFSGWDGMPPGRRVNLELNGQRFCRGIQNVSVTYTAGYLVDNEAGTVDGAADPANSVTVQAPYGSWGSDQGVTYANGTPLVAVKAAPSAGQYQLDTTPGIYVFNAADAGADVLISYGFVPAVIEEACVQMVAERYSYRARVGSRSKTLGGLETMSYDRSPIPPEVTAMLRSYCSVAPV
jgi:hypothetical protein